MKIQVHSVRIIGVHSVVPTAQQFQDALESMWGDWLKGKELQRAQEETKKHFDGLYLIEVDITPKDADVNWSEFTQQMDDTPREQWQVPWDEQPIDGEGNRWAFFLHFVDLGRPLLTPGGELKLPGPTPTPPHLTGIVYFVPG